MNSPARHTESTGRARSAQAREPRIHSHITDRLPERHPFAQTRVRCDRCDSLLHLHSNSCMRTWVETGSGNFCLRCFVLAAGGTTPAHRSELAGVDCLPPAFGIDDSWL